jgi:hypothetical protein
MAAQHTWNFFRAGGFDQVQIDTGADMLALKELDQKLWVALSCPARGIEFDPKTLDLIDSDADGRVRANEVLAAIAWVGKLLVDADLLVGGSDRLALADIDNGTEAGRQILACAIHILKSLGKPDAAEISLTDLDDVEKLVAQQIFNGDGIVTPAQAGNESLRATLADIIACCGSLSDLSGDAGVDQALSDRFFAEAVALSDWHAKGERDASILFLGDKTEAAAKIFYAVRDKIDDYFTRCQLAAYDTRAAAPLSRSVEDYQHLAALPLSAQSEEVAGFPLAIIAPDKPLSLVDGINPAWQEALDMLKILVVMPLLGEMDALGFVEWRALCARFAPFDAWQSGKPAGAVEQLGLSRLREILAGGHQADIALLIGQDKAVEAEVNAIHAVERLLRYNRDLFKLVNNFVSFRNFYTGRDKAIFQVGTLYLDGRSCDLTVKVEDVARHAAFAAMSGVCLVYCDCVRGALKMNIAAAFTAGDSDYLMVGRNGIFYDRRGQDWDATIVRIIDHPISMRQAFWSPYKKLIKAVSEQIQKLAATKASTAESGMIKAVLDNGTVVASAPAAPPKSAFDVGKFAGIFAAIGLAIGAIGGILASVVGGVLGLKFWQIPLALAGLVLLVSGPSVVLAWFKLKKRSLAPILDACGWAINARARINIPFGTSLTCQAVLPPGAHRSLVDPFAEKKALWPYLLLTAALAGSLAGLWYFGFFEGGK